MTHPIIVWFRQDLRLTDHLALCEALSQGRPIIPLYILEEGEAWPLGGASQWWLHYSLEALSKDIQKRGGSLILRRGDPLQVLRQVIQESGATGVFWSRRYDPSGIRTDSHIKETLKSQGLDVRSFNSHLLVEPWTLQTKQGLPYQVFTPFWKACLAFLNPEAPLGAPEHIPTYSVASDPLSSWALLPTHPDWAQGLRETWHPGEKGALDRLDAFLDHHVESYKDKRNYPATNATSMLSPHLRWGEISPRVIWHRLHTVMAHDSKTHQGGQSFLSEMGWREFSYHLLYHFPFIPEKPLRASFEVFPWQEAPDLLKAWQQGLTGYPIVDAGMRQLWRTGWMHNRVRMLVASFLVKDLLLPWQKGEEWFWDTLVDADLANNSASWQWVAGCGADAAPYFRIFNPVLQGEKFDPEGHYVREWIPELANLPKDLIHKPWTASKQRLASYGVILGQTYPYPIVDHDQARHRALQLFQTLKKPREGDSRGGDE